jgi:hypothetical protein
MIRKVIYWTLKGNNGIIFRLSQFFIKIHFNIILLATPAILQRKESKASGWENLSSLKITLLM